MTRGREEEKKRKKKKDLVRYCICIFNQVWLKSRKKGTFYHIKIVISEQTLCIIAWSTWK